MQQFFPWGVAIPIHFCIVSNIAETFAKCGSKSLKWPKSPPSKVLQLEEDLSTWCKVLDIFRELLNVSSQMESALAFPCVSLHSALQKGDIFSPHCLPISNTDYTTDKRKSKCISLATCATPSDCFCILTGKQKFDPSSEWACSSPGWCSRVDDS